MNYRFRCNSCLKEFDIDIKIDEYTNWKASAHSCPLCGKMSFAERVFEPFTGLIGSTGGYDATVGNASWQG